MTFTMSTEGDSVKSALSETNDKHALGNHTDDSSQDSADAKDLQCEKPTENNIGNGKEEEKPSKEESTEAESDQESEASEKKEDEVKKDEEKPEENDKKPENDTDGLDKEKEEKSEEEEEGEEEEEEDEETPKKEEKEPKEPTKVKEPKEKDEKASTASEKDDEEEEAEEEEEEEVEGKEVVEGKKGKKKGVPLLDQPLETSGKRERKNVQRFETDVKEKELTKIEVDQGSGTPLGEIPRIEASIMRFKNDDLKVLHRFLFKTTGKSTQFKKNIKKFNGFAFKKDSDEYKKRIESCHKIEMKQLKSICEMLDLAKNGNKDELTERVMEFLLEPKDSGKPVGGGRPKRASAVRANNRGYSSHDDYSSDDKHSSRARRDKGKRPNLKEDSTSDEEFKPGEASDASDEKPRTVSKRKRGRAKKGSSEEDEASISGATSDDSDDVPKSKRRKSVTKATPKGKPKTPGRGRGRSRGTPAAAATTTPRKSGRERKPVRKHESSDEDEEEKMEEGSSSEDEPLVKKKAKNSEPPTDDEIKTYVKSILEGANLEEITMKTVCQRVYDNYPDFDLTARKNFIKSTVKSLIST